MGTILFIIVLVGLAFVLISYVRRGQSGGGARRPAQLQDAEAEARRWTERLGAGVLNLDGAGNKAATQALADASERHNAASSQLTSANSVQQYRLVTATALEGLYYIRAARVALGLDPGPELPGAENHQSTGGRAEVDGQVYEGTPHPTSANPYYFPGGQMNGRMMPGGWYQTPWWKSALVGAAGAFGGIMLADAMFGGFGGFGDGGFGGFDGGGSDGGGFDGGMAGGVDGGGYDGGGGFDGGDFGGGDFGGGDF